MSASPDDTSPHEAWASEDDEMEALRPVGPTRRRSGMQLRAVPNAVDTTPVLPEEQDVRRLSTMLDEDIALLTRSLDRALARLDWAARKADARRPAFWLLLRVGDVAAVRDALVDLREAAGDARLSPLYESDAPLGPFLRGIALWCDGVLEAVAEQGSLLARGGWHPLMFRERTAQAAQFHFAGLLPQVREHLRRMQMARRGGGQLFVLRDRIDELVFATRWLEARLR